MTSMIDAGFNSYHLKTSERSVLRLAALQNINPADYDKDGNHHELHAAIAVCNSDASPAVRNAILPAHELLTSNGINAELSVEDFQNQCNNFIDKNDKGRFAGYTFLAQHQSDLSFIEPTVAYMNEIVKKNSKDPQMSYFTSHAILCSFGLGYNANNADLMASTINNLWDTQRNSMPIYIPNPMDIKAIEQVTKESAGIMKDKPEILSTLAAITSCNQHHYESLGKNNLNFIPFAESMKESYLLVQSVNKEAAEKGKLFGEDLYGSYKIQEFAHEVNQIINTATGSNNKLHVYTGEGVTVYGITGPKIN